MMRKPNILRTLLVILAVTATFMAFSALKNKAVGGDSACKEGLESCPKKQKSSKMIWENLSHQFFSGI